VSELRPITGERTTLPVLGRTTDAAGVRWLHVLLPGRPNGHAGWIRRSATTRAVTSWHIVIHTADRRVTVYRHGRLIRSFTAIVGKSSTPTPHGTFFVEESIELRPGDVGAPYALALSARSDVFQEFAGGPGQIALHGLANVGGVLGTAVSHGCVRLANAAMSWLVGRIGPGVPVTITR
jgi:lipoprotein-anchoring transpeptidase ErfK/SrfK